MSTLAAVMTGKGTGAISTVQIFGETAEAVLKKIFKPAGTRPLKFKTGEILLGTINENTKVIDQVTIGCEGPDTFAINCHGNPLIVEMIMQLLGRHGVELVTEGQLLNKILSSETTTNSIAVEAKLAQAEAKTLQGTKIVANQIKGGLSKKLGDWLAKIDEISLKTIKKETDEILQKSRAAKLIIYGCTAVLTGPPNSGKSTLLNCLAGRQKAIVTDIKGTTRDWVEATCNIEPLQLRLIDTAGLYEKSRAMKDAIEKAARKKTIEILERADLVLLILDNSRPREELDVRLLEKITDKLIIRVLNKSDLPAKFDKSRTPDIFSHTVSISARQGTGIDELKEQIRKTTGVRDFDMNQPVCFTGRQENLLIKLSNARSKHQASSIITDLLKGHI